METTLNTEGNIANITTSFIEIPGKICVSIYLSGCIFNCPDCHNADLQNVNYGERVRVSDVLKIINDNTLAKWVCFLGGEPCFQHEFLFDLCKNITKPIGIYTGNDFDTVREKYEHIIELPNVRFLKCGKFMIEKIVNGEFPVTSNQEVFLKRDNIWVKCYTRSVIGVSDDIISAFSNPCDT